MLTIFSNPRPFQGIFDIIQRNAIKSWMKLFPKCEIILFEDEEKTTSKVAEQFGLKCVTDVACNEFGTPLFNDVLGKIRQTAANDIIAQVNSDIILMSDFPKAIKQARSILGEKNFFMTGRRWDLDVKEEIDFNNSSWEEKLREKIKKEGRRHGLAGLDYWIFPKKLNINPPPFVVGRPGMDSWLIYKARSLRIPVIDATDVVDIIHQNHNYPRKKDHYFEIEKQRNIKRAGGLSCMCTLRDADWRLTRGGLRKQVFPVRIFSALSLFYPWRFLLLIKRKLQRIIKF